VTVIAVLIVADIECFGMNSTGADPNANLDRSQAKPLHAVIRRGDPRLVDYLLQAGADVNGTDGMSFYIFILYRLTNFFILTSNV
jgi:ankyrin repeat protein